MPRGLPLCLSFGGNVSADRFLKTALPGRLKYQHYDYPQLGFPRSTLVHLLYLGADLVSGAGESNLPLFFQDPWFPF